MKKIDSVCIVDDDLVYQYLAKEEIEYTELVNKIMFFEDGETAISFMKTTLDNNAAEQLPDVIFLDINRPIIWLGVFRRVYKIKAVYR